MAAAVFADRLWEAVRRCGNRCCVGLDPDPQLMPRSILEHFLARENDRTAMVKAIGYFCHGVLETITGQAPAVKVQFAYFERWGWPGIQLMESLIQQARQAGLVVIGDGKRADIAKTAQAYAHAYLDDESWMPDALTVNPYLGLDGLQPFAEVAQQHSKGIFVLARTSNAGAAAIQGELSEATSVIHRVVAAIRSLENMGLGECGLGLVGAVAGATYPSDLKHLLTLLPRSWLLLPGFGAQGAQASALAEVLASPSVPCLCTAARTILYPVDSAGKAAASHDKFLPPIAAALHEFCALTALPSA